MSTTSISSPVEAQRLRGVARSQWGLAFERFRAHRPALVGMFVLATLAVVCAAAPIISPYDPDKTALLSLYEGPTLQHPFGTDDLGRDLATRILYGGRVSLTIGLLAVSVALTVGTLVGVVAGYYGGFLDNLLMRIVDALYSFPRLFLLILFSVLAKGMTVGVVILVLGLLSWLTTSRLVRATFLSLKQREFVEAARAVGARDGRIIFRHILPNSLAPIIVAGTLGVGGAIIAESTLSFLGLGIQPPTASWGNMLNHATTDMGKAPWLAFFPGFFIFLAVMSINFIGDGLRDALDPRHVIRTQRR